MKAEIGAALEDDCIEMRLSADTFSCSETFDAVRVTDESFSEFAMYHDERHPDKYWSSERFRRDLSRWGLFCLRDNHRITGYICIFMGNPVQAEIFFVEASDSANCKRLIVSAARYAFDNGKNEVLYMADDNTFSHGAALSVGFAVTGFYKGYMVKRA